MKDREVQVGDKVLLKQDKTTIRPPFDPEPFEVTSVHGTKVEAERGGMKRTRNLGKWKVLKPRPAHLRRSQTRLQKQEDETEDSDDESYISIQSMKPNGEHRELGEKEVLPREAPEAAQPLILPTVPTQPAPPTTREPLASPPTLPTQPTLARPRRNPKPIQRFGYEEQGGSSQHVKQLSPKERKKRKGIARKSVKNSSKERWVMEPGTWFQSPTGWQKRGAAD